MADQPALMTIVDRIIELVKTIDGDETEWRTSVRTASRFRGASDLDLPRPAVMVEAAVDEGELVAQSAGYYEAIPVDIVGLVRNPTDPQGAANDLARDLKKLVRANPTIQAIDGTRLATDWRERSTAVVVVDPNLGGDGGAQVTVPTRLLFVTTDAAP